LDRPALVDEHGVAVDLGHAQGVAAVERAGQLDGVAADGVVADGEEVAVGVGAVLGQRQLGAVVPVGVPDAGVAAPAARGQEGEQGEDEEGLEKVAWHDRSQGLEGCCPPT